MSKVPVWVYCSDGYFYKDPIWRDVHNGIEYYVTVDDDDPIEVVLNISGQQEKLKAELKERKEDWVSLFPKLSWLSYYNQALHSERLFPSDNWKSFRPAVARWAAMVGVPPVPFKYSSKADAPKGQCIYYDVRNKNGR